MDEDSIHYTSPNHPYHLMTAINHLRQKQMLCDIQLIVDQYNIPVHKLILSVCTPYFKNLADSKRDTSSISEIRLNGLDGESVQQIIEFFYTSAISVNEATVWNLLPAASTLQVEEVQNLCCEYLSSHVQLENCLAIHKLAAKCLCSALLKETTDYILTNFEKILEEESFLDMTVDDMLSELRLLSDTGLPEDKVLQGIKCWLIYCLEERQSDGSKIVKELPYLKEKLQEFIPDEYLKEIEEGVQIIPEKRIRKDGLSLREMSIGYEDALTDIVSDSDEKRSLARSDADDELEQDEERSSPRPGQNEERSSPRPDTEDGPEQEEGRSLSRPDTDDEPEQDEETSLPRPYTDDGPGQDEEASLPRSDVDDEPGQEKRSLSGPATDDEPGQKSKKVWLCDQCSFSSARKDNLQRHINGIHGKKEHWCTECSRHFSSEEERDAHKATHTSCFICDVCGKSYKSRGGIKLHMKQTHDSDSAKYSCHICLKSFHDYNHYKGHLNMHLGVKPYQCLKCLKRFGYKSNYSRHVTSCDGEPSGSTGGDVEHKCTVCSKKFSNKFRLKEHQRGKHSNRAYTCSICEKSFSWRSGFLKHKKKCPVDNALSCKTVSVSEIQYICTICSKQFSNKRGLKEHYQGKHGDPAYACTNCKKSFSWKSSLLKHRKKCQI